jgi:hypothetical protein
MAFHGGHVRIDLTSSRGVRPRENYPRTGWLSSRMVFALIALWSLAVAVGFAELWSYEGVRGDHESPPPDWPAASKITRDGRPTLLLFAHPHCPCTRATLAELERLLAIFSDQLAAHVLFIAPDRTDSSWNDAPLYGAASRIPGLTVHEDTDRHEADLFRARTSGFCLLYDGNGRLQFQGGLTASRGHEGASQGINSIKAFLRGETAPPKTPVFGCPLHESDDGTGQPGSPSMKGPRS